MKFLVDGWVWVVGNRSWFKELLGEVKKIKKDRTDKIYGQQLVGEINAHTDTGDIT